MKTTTPYAKINKIVFNHARFKTLEDAENYIKKHGTDDYIAVDNILYTMMEYDMGGQIIQYYNKRTNNMLEVKTSNRYKNGFGDATLELYENYGVYRNDISYAD